MRTHSIGFAETLSRLYRAIENIVRNAVRYTAAGTEVSIRLRQNQQAEGTAAVNIKVRDHEPGIPEEEAQKIFSPFYRVDPARSAQTGGFGVGLAIAERAIRLHGGKIVAQNHPDGGTVVRITLQLAVNEETQSK